MSGGRGLGGWICILGLTLVGSIAAPAGAQTASDPGRIPAQRLRPAMDREGILVLESGTLAAPGNWDAALWLSYERDPLVLYLDDGSRGGKLVQDRVDADLVASMVFLEWFELGLATRLTLYQGRPSEAPVAPGGLPPLAAFGVGDVRLSPKLRIVSEARYGFGLAGILHLTLPTGLSHSHLGDIGLTATPELAVTKSIEAFTLTANLGYLLRGRYEVFDLLVDDEIHWRLGARWRADNGPLYLDVALTGALSAMEWFSRRNTTPVEMLLGGGYALDANVELFGGLGMGLTRGYANPAYRIFVGVRYGVRRSDRDGDGIEDRIDRCVDVPEDRDGFEDRDGCPDPDNDGDGVLDVKDRCPDLAGAPENAGCPDVDTDGDGVLDRNDGCPKVAEDRDGFEDEDGCPDTDNDRDGLTDAKDACPNEAGPAETKGCPETDSDGDGLYDGQDRCPEEAGPKENEGCPDTDQDGDGIVDRLDACPTKVEDLDGFEDEDGCPDADNDGDGITDALDRCPMEEGIPENRGCPDRDSDGDGIVDRLDNCPNEPGVKENFGCKKKQLVVIRKDKLEILEKVYFASGKAKIRRRSYPLLDNVARVLKEHPEIEKVIIEGHTDSRGSDAYNKRLSQRRADAVRAYLIRKGIDPARLEAIGYGEERPVASNETKEGRERNRRVEFRIPGGATTEVIEGETIELPSDTVQSHPLPRPGTPAGGAQGTAQGGPKGEEEGGAKERTPEAGERAPE
ncbi:MAG: hypothetical protein D6729_05340 [Deltaproteobacteria bacterium]|nr:MAG: hypothetical protein D6729_05340 [Deltaproteobacteria bacterium]